jgi:hypothetical protein
MAAHDAIAAIRIQLPVFIIDSSQSVFQRNYRVCAPLTRGMPSRHGQNASALRALCCARKRKRMPEFAKRCDQHGRRDDHPVARTQVGEMRSDCPAHQERSGEQQRHLQSEQSHRQWLGRTDFPP